MRTIPLAGVTVLGISALLLSCGPATTRHEPRPAMPPGITLPDSGTVAIRVRGQPLGRESFLINRGADGMTTVRVHSSAVGFNMASDLRVGLSLTGALLPTVVTVTGVTRGVPVADTLSFRGDTAHLRRAGSTQVFPAGGGRSFVGSNFHVGIWLAFARYDFSRGGRQTIPVFPSLDLVVEPIPHRPRGWKLSIAGVFATVWIDGGSRLAAILYPDLGLEAIREGDEFRATVSLARSATADLERSRIAHADTVVAAGLHAEEMLVPVGPKATLAGTLLEPSGKGPFPAVVLISGSGPQDRDGRIGIPGMQDYRPFRDIALALAGSGIAVLRLDDRGVGGSSEVPESSATTTWTTAADVQAAVAALRRRVEIDSSSIGLLGHSEGALAAMMVAAADSTVAALVLLAAPAVRGDSLLTAQLEEQLAVTPGLTEIAKDSARGAQQQLFAMIRRDTTSRDPATTWLRTLLDLRPADLAARVRRPVLVLHGGRDRQVPSSQAVALGRMLERAGTEVSVAIYDSLNHLMIRARTGAVSEYSTLESYELDANFLNRLTEWLRARLQGLPAR